MKHELPQGVRLGKSQDYSDQYDPSLLVPVPRQLGRADLSNLRFYGEDRWTGYELSWLDTTGKPQVAVAEFCVPCESANIVESKSFKYYLNSFNQTEFPHWHDVQSLLVRDLSQIAQGEVGVELYSLVEFHQRRLSAVSMGKSIDESPLLGAAPSRPDADLLQQVAGHFDGVWVSDLLKSNCPVTGQPDWASIWIGYRGPALNESALLSYLVSFRRHDDFHENCVERIFSDIYAVSKPENLWVYARYTRRGGLDINPFRSLEPMVAPALWGVRQ